ncbi:hypothetical protein GCM10010420_13670 [Streptomyces glaucosporus]|uniref:Anti-sigma factor antagonist n=1 Tax=Streptomyces glaucosporus TaxID=284044 RepID=A0ABP5UZ72_9ACTN
MHDDRDAPHPPPETHERPEPPETLSVEVRPLSGGRLLLVLVGELDHHSADLVTGEVRSALEAGAAAVLLDLSGVSFIDSTGVTRLLLAHRTARAAGGRLALIAPSGPVRRLLSLTGIDRVLACHPTPDAVPPGPGAGREPRSGG